MTERRIALRVRRIIAEVFSLEVENVAPEASPETIEAWDSVGHLNLIIALEQEFGVQFTLGDIEKMIDAPGIVRVLNERCTA